MSNNAFLDRAKEIRATIDNAMFLNKEDECYVGHVDMSYAELFDLIDELVITIGILGPQDIVETMKVPGAVYYTTEAKLVKIGPSKS
jgi:hypothetical protein